MCYVEHRFSICRYSRIVNALRNKENAADTVKTLQKQGLSFPSMTGMGMGGYGYGYRYGNNGGGNDNIGYNC